MTKFKYLKLRKNKKIRYLTVQPKRKIYIVFLHGFMSDLEGKKPKNFLIIVKKNRFSSSRIFRTWKIIRRIFKR